MAAPAFWPDIDVYFRQDIGLALEMGRDLAVPLPTTKVADHYLAAASAQGLADEDFAMVFKVLARASGVIE